MARPRLRPLRWALWCVVLWLWGCSLAIGDLTLPEAGTDAQDLATPIGPPDLAPHVPDGGADMLPGDLGPRDG